MKNKIAEDMRMDGNAKFYHVIHFASVNDIKSDIIDVIKKYGTNYALCDYIDLFHHADYWLLPSIVNSQDEKFRRLMTEIMAFDVSEFITEQYNNI